METDGWAQRTNAEAGRVRRFFQRRFFHLTPPPGNATFSPSSGGARQGKASRDQSAVSSGVEHYLDTVGVTGSKPVSRTIFFTL